MEKIVASAIKFQIPPSSYWWIVSGKRHCNCFEVMFEHQIKYDKLTHIQGFLTDKDRFIDRFEAYQLALSNGQLKVETLDHASNMLYSEDLW